MTQGEKQLLLKDLSARFPYRVMIKSVGENKVIGLWDLKDVDNLPLPYLRPMSSMIEKEKKERDFYCGDKPYGKNIGESYLTEYDMPDYLDWLLEHHFDYRGLIEKGLALEAPNDMYDR